MNVSYVKLEVMEETSVATATTTATTKAISLDEINLKIIKLLSRDCRIPFRNIASIIGITPNAVKTRVTKMISKRIIQKFIVKVNPVVFGYESECILIARYHNKRLIKEEDIRKKLNLVGDIFAYITSLGRAAIFLIVVKAGTEDKIELIADLVKPVVVETRFIPMKPVPMKITTSDLRIIKCLLSDARMGITDIAKQASISSRTVTRRLEKMRQKHILMNFTILKDVSSMQLTGYIEFVVLINIDRSLHQYILERIHNELNEYLRVIINPNQREVIFAAFSYSNIPTVDSILTTIESYNGVRQIELFILTKIAYPQEWLKREINKRLIS
jgi:DNA-binding Lrp family transcriptional regulator